MLRYLASLTGLIAVGVAATVASPPADAADAAASAAKSSYVKERADCDSGRTAEDRATCLREAGAAQDERKRNRLDNAGSTRENATARCNALPAADKADCMARIEGSTAANQKTKTSGSVAGGGVLRETTTTTTGQPTVITVPAASAPR
jgi:aminopeptidase N